MNTNKWVVASLSVGVGIAMPLCAHASFEVNYSDSYYAPDETQVDDQGQTVYYDSGYDNGPYQPMQRYASYHHHHHRYSHAHYTPASTSVDYAARMPSQITPGEKMILVDPNVHAWGAYDANGMLVKGGIATAGSNYCPDIGRRCHTKSGTFHIKSLGSVNCKSSKYPLPYGGAPMPYCMYFNGSQGLHGSNEVVDGNASHGCVRLRTSDAAWIRYNFATIGTKVVVKPY